MGTPSPMRRSKASRAYERLLKRESTADEYWKTLRQEASEDVERLLNRRRAKAKA
jgi:hypothetical protein